MMKSLKTTLRFFAAVLLSIPFQLSTAQPYVINGIDYKQISSFETNYGISTMKISSDGSKIVFATGGAEVKVYTISTDGSGLTMIYDFERTGSAPMVDITANGEGVIWCDGEGEIFIAKSNGTERLELATLLPDPDPNRDFIEPIIPLPPRLTYDGSEVYFIHMDRDPMASGVYKINSDNSGLELKFNYLDMAEDLFGTDGSEYNQNVAFADGFDISSYGNRILVGTRIFRLAEGDVGRGDAIGYDGADFFNLGEYATGTQPFSTDQDRADGS